jgi:hypothetical protein
MAGPTVTGRSGLGFAEYLKEQGKRVGERMRERKKNQRRNVWWGRREKKSNFFFFF